MQKKKGIALVLSFALVACLAVAGTLAWLTDKTEKVENTFTVGKVDIVLDESQANYNEKTAKWDLNTDARVYKNEYKNVYPGAEIAKDPLVTVKAGSEACWLFVTVSPAPDDHTLLEYGIDDGWTELEHGVYYRSVDSLVNATDDLEFSVLKNEKVVVKTSATGASTFENIVFYAYAIQSAGMNSAADAWAALNA